jgi:hypothetical protein
MRENAPVGHAGSHWAFLTEGPVEAAIVMLLQPYHQVFASVPCQALPPAAPPAASLAS